MEDNNNMKPAKKTKNTYSVTFQGKTYSETTTRVCGFAFIVMGDDGEIARAGFSKTQRAAEGRLKALRTEMEEIAALHRDGKHHKVDWGFSLVNSAILPV